MLELSYCKPLQVWIDWNLIWTMAWCGMLVRSVLLAHVTFAAGAGSKPLFDYEDHYVMLMLRRTRWPHRTALCEHTGLEKITCKWSHASKPRPISNSKLKIEFHIQFEDSCEAKEWLWSESFLQECFGSCPSQAIVLSMLIDAGFDQVDRKDSCAI